MTTWADLLLELRTDLDDTSATPKFSDNLLYLYAKDGIRDYSTWFPKRTDRTKITPTNGAFSLPGDFVQDLFVECPLDTYLQKRLPLGGKIYPFSQSPSSTTFPVGACMSQALPPRST